MRIGMSIVTVILFGLHYENIAKSAKLVFKTFGIQQVYHQPISYALMVVALMILIVVNIRAMKKNKEKSIS